MVWRDPLVRDGDICFKKWKWTEILKIVDSFIEKLVRQQVNENKMQFGFITGCGTKDFMFILQQSQQKYFAKKRIFNPHLWSGEILLGRAIGARRGDVDSELTRRKNTWSKFWDLLLLLICFSVRQCRSNNSPFKDVIKLERNDDTRMVRSRC